MNQFLTVRCQDFVFGLPVQELQEIVTWLTPSPIPGSRPYVLGMVNLRGHMLPVYDLAHRLGFQRMKETNLSCLVLTHRTSAEIGVHELALAVDEVLDVQEFAPAKAPPMGLPISSRHLAGLVHIRDENLIYCLNLQAILEERFEAGQASLAS